MASSFEPRAGSRLGAVALDRPAPTGEPWDRGPRPAGTFSELPKRKEPGISSGLSGLYPPPGTCQTLLPRDGIGLTGRECNWRCSTSSRLAAQRSIRDRAKVSVPGTAWLQGSCPGHKSTVKSAPTTDSGGEELISAVPRATRHCKRQVVVQQAGVRWQRRTRGSTPQKLDLSGIPEVRVRVVVRDFSRRNAPNRRRSGGFIGRYPRPQQVWDGDRRNDQYDRNHDQ